MPDGMHLMIPASEYAEMESKIERLEKALDKACEVMVNRVNVDSGDGTPTLRFTKEQWKEWCMKNV